MVPVLLMDTDLDYKKPNSIKVEVDTDYGSILVKSDGIGSTCLENHEKKFNDAVALFDERSALKDPEDVEVDIVTCKHINESSVPEVEDPDATEYSSSFANTLSDGEKCSGLSENEIESQFFGDSDFPSSYNAFSNIFQTRKKKLTNHWRRFIRPLMWRCKWTELKIKEIESQALRYAGELAAYGQSKHSQMYESPFEGFLSKSLPFSNQRYRRGSVKRRKRKRIEDKIDTAAYLLHHTLFSYLESKRSNRDGSSMIDDFDNGAIPERHADHKDNFGNENDEISFEFEGGDNSLEHLLWKIETVQTRVQKLKSQLDVVMPKNASKFSSSENLSLLALCDAQTSSAPSPTFSAGNGDAISAGAMPNTTQPVSGYDIGDLAMPYSIVSSNGEAIHLPDIIESTVGLLSVADVTFHQAHNVDSCEDIVDNVLIHTEATEGERDALKGTANNQLLEKHHELDKDEEGESFGPCPMPTSEPDPMVKTIATRGESILRSCLPLDLQIPRNKRKRAERKAGSGGWN